MNDYAATTQLISSWGFNLSQLTSIQLCKNNSFKSAGRFGKSINRYDKSFTRALNMLEDAIANKRTEDTERVIGCSLDKNNKGWLRIPFDSFEKNKCYLLNFEK